VATIATATAANHYLTFVDANNVSATQETVYTDAGLYYNPSTNQLLVTGVISTQGKTVYLQTGTPASPVAGDVWITY
jgi:hypothetical protein